MAGFDWRRLGLRDLAMTTIGPSFALAGRKALVTGTSQGLGRHFARVLAHAGASVILAGRQTEKMHTLCDELRTAGKDCSVAVFDAQNFASIEALSPAMQGLDILVNNAGVGRGATALNQSEAQWDEVLDTNLKGLFFVAQAAGRAMREHGRGGSIINIASVAGIRQAIGLLPYHVSKSGVIQLTKTLALELARFNVRVNAIAPGSFLTEATEAFWQTEAGKAMLQRIPQRRLGQMQDLDGPLLLLASDASAYMTGSVLAVDGGHLVSSL
jgi:NAD(P)-dependent dehydrogenase (short-subunit alcohol dehydrogenase family)